MSGKRIFHLYVKADELSYKTLLFIDEAIYTLNAMGIFIKIKKFADKDMNESMIKALERKGITQIPVIITDDNKQWIGLKNIKNKFMENIQEWENYIRSMNNSEAQKKPQTNIDRMTAMPRNPLTQDILEDITHDEMRHLKKVGDKYMFDDDAEQVEGFGEGSGDFRQAIEQQNKRRQETVRKMTPGKVGSLDEKMESIDTRGNKRKGGNGGGGRGGGGGADQSLNINHLRNTPEGRDLNSEDMDILNKINGGDDNTYGDNVGGGGEEEYRRQALESFTSGGLD